MADGHDKDTAAFIISLLRLRGIGPKTVAAFLDAESVRIGSADRLDATFIEALESKGSAKAAVIARSLRNSSYAWDDLETSAYETLELAETRGIHILHPLMAAYPKRLLRKQRRPPILYCKGEPDSLNQEKSVAIVGTRNPTSFGERMGRRLAEMLAEDGYVVVSGLALGCDTAGHEGALAARGRTVAVLPTPVDAPVYPKQNQELAARILDAGGALVSEYEPGVELSDRQLISNLVARDEWQPALSDGVVVIETGIDGGTRHAVGHALDGGVPVAVFDYRYNEKLRSAFENDPRFGGNRHYLALESGVTPIYGPETIEAFKAQMDAFRARGGTGLARNAATGSGDAVQVPLPLF